MVPWDWEKSGIAEADCFLCHVPKASRGVRRKADGRGELPLGEQRHARWYRHGYAEQDKGAFAYNRAAFNPDGTVKPEVLDLSDPAIENCAMCHGFTARNTTTIQPIQFADIARGTEKAGWIYNGAKISDTESRLKWSGKRRWTIPGMPTRLKGVRLHRLPLRP